MSTNFVYVTYIRTTPEKLWQALTNAEFTKQYWFGFHPETTWNPGSPWKLIHPDGRISDTGEVIECVKPKRIVLKWRNEFMPELKAEGDTRCVMELEENGEMVKLTISHSMERDNSQFIGRVSGGWPQILSSLKSLLETGKALPRPA